MFCIQDLYICREVSIGEGFWDVKRMDDEVILF